MLLCHFSDWHGEWGDLPKADVYVCTGDMFYNYPNMRGMIEERRETFLQAREARRQKCRKFLGNPDAHVVTVRGNHDFTSLSPLFTGGPVYEICDPEESFEIEGRKFGGMRGIPWIGGTWSDERQRADLDTDALELPMDLNVMVTHAPPYGLLDAAPAMSGRGGWEHTGVNGFSHYHAARAYHNLYPYDYKLHCFGHIHEGFGTRREDDTLFSNAATGYHLIEVKSVARVLESSQCFK